MSCPSGFCVGYIKNETDQLRQCDNFRHQYYEFRATYFFIHLLIKQGAEILSIYSNYHGLGIFCIAQYPIDLFVTTKNLGKHLIQFDHMYTHGCRQGCPGLLRYAGNKSRFQVEKQSQERDNVIEQWIQNLNNKEFKYHVVSECHTKNFDKKNLDLAFCKYPFYKNWCNLICVCSKKYLHSSHFQKLILNLLLSFFVKDTYLNTNKVKMSFLQYLCGKIPVPIKAAKIGIKILQTKRKQK